MMQSAGITALGLLLDIVGFWILVSDLLPQYLLDRKIGRASRQMKQIEKIRLYSAAQHAVLKAVIDDNFQRALRDAADFDADRRRGPVLLGVWLITAGFVFQLVGALLGGLR